MEPEGSSSRSYDRSLLQRFELAQAEGVFERALGEITAGRKQTHWIWFILPQLRGLGVSETAAHFGIAGREEARAYLSHRLLGPRLRAAASAALQWAGKRDAEEIFGYPDCLKFRSCATLFAAVAEPASEFHQVLEAFFAGEPDTRTLELLQASERFGA